MIDNRISPDLQPNSTLFYDADECLEKRDVERGYRDDNIGAFVCGDLDPGCVPRGDLSRVFPITKINGKRQAPFRVALTGLEFWTLIFTSRSREVKWIAWIFTCSRVMIGSFNSGIVLGRTIQPISLIESLSYFISRRSCSIRIKTAGTNPSLISEGIDTSLMVSGLANFFWDVSGI